MGAFHLGSKHISLKKNARKQATKHIPPFELLLKGTKQWAVLEAGRFAGLGVPGDSKILVTKALSE